MDSKLLRARARENLRGMWPVAIGVAAIAYLLGGLMFGAQFFPELKTEFTATDLEALRNFEFDRINTHMRVGNINTIGLVGFILGGVIQLGYGQFLLKQHDKLEPTWNDLFSQFHRFGQGFAQKFLRGLYCFLWGLLFIIPGIVKAYSYAMTPYIMTEHPEMTANEAITASRQLMDGHKGELFLLRLSFIGWMILNIFTLGIGSLWLTPYIQATEAAFYRELTGTTRTANTYVEYE